MQVKYVGPLQKDVSGYGYNFPQGGAIEIDDGRVLGKCRANQEFEVLEESDEAETATFEEVEEDGDSTGSEKLSTKKPRRNKVQGSGRSGAPSGD